MIIFSLTKRLNKAAAPKLLSWSLRLHESLCSSPMLPSFVSPNAISLLPLAQRIVSIEVQDDYRRLQSGEAKSDVVSMRSEWDNFVDQAWDVFFEDRHRRLKAERDEAAEAEARRLWDAKQRKRQRRKQRRSRPERTKAKARVDNYQCEELLELGERRVRLLDNYLRPALLPSESLRNRHLFAHHHHHQNHSEPSTNADYDAFVKWIRGEYLIAKYGPIVQRAVKQCPELRDDAAGLSTLEVEADEAPLKLPSVDAVRRAFGMQNWNRRKLPPEGEGGNAMESDGQENAEEETIHHIIHNKLRGQIAHSGPLNAYFEMRRREDSYELWTKEYVFGLARYLLDRIAEMDRQAALSTSRSASPTETIILDVGAGDGRLVYFLRKAMKEIVKKKTNLSTSATVPSGLPTIIATDNGSWKAPIYDNQHIRVEQLSAVEALEKYGILPMTAQEGGAKTRLIVLCSWMPPGQDWTADFRRPLNHAASTNAGDGAGVERIAEEYVLIGEADNGTCGHNWYTWGNPDFGTEGDAVAPHVMDGYERVNLHDLSLLQFSRFDCKRSSESMTVCFRRKNYENEV